MTTKYLVRSYKDCGDYWADVNEFCDNWAGVEYEVSRYWEAYHTCKEAKCEVYVLGDTLDVRDIKKAAIQKSKEKQKQLDLEQQRRAEEFERAQLAKLKAKYEP